MESHPATDRTEDGRACIGATLALGLAYAVTQTVAWLDWSPQVASAIEPFPEARLAAYGFYVLTGLHALACFGRVALAGLGADGGAAPAIAMGFGRMRPIGTSLTSLGCSCGCCCCSPGEARRYTLSDLERNVLWLPIASEYFDSVRPR